MSKQDRFNELQRRINATHTPRDPLQYYLPTKQQFYADQAAHPTPTETALNLARDEITRLNELRKQLQAENEDLKEQRNRARLDAEREANKRHAAEIARLKDRLGEMQALAADKCTEAARLADQVRALTAVIRGA